MKAETSARRTLVLPALVIPALALLGFVYVWPMLGLGRMAFNETGPTGAMVPAASLQTFRTLFEDPFTLETTWNSLWLSLVSTTLALALAYPLALFLHRTQSRWKALLTVLAVAPMLVSGVVRVFGWLAILGDRGLINALLLQVGATSAPVRLVYNYFGVAIGLAESLMPYMILALLAGFGRLDRALEEAAASLGAGPRRVFLRVTLPLTAPAVVLGWLLCFVLAMSAYLTPKLLGGGRVFLLATEIFDQAVTNVNWPAAAALALYALVLVMTLVGLYAWLTRRSRHEGGAEHAAEVDGRCRLPVPARAGRGRRLHLLLGRQLHRLPALRLLAALVRAAAGARGADAGPVVVPAAGRGRDSSCPFSLACRRRLALARSDGPAARGLRAFFLAPLVLPTLVLGLALLMALQPLRLTATLPALRWASRGDGALRHPADDDDLRDAAGRSGSGSGEPRGHSLARLPARNVAAGFARARRLGLPRLPALFRRDGDFAVPLRPPRLHAAGRDGALCRGAHRSAGRGALRRTGRRHAGGGALVDRMAGLTKVVGR